MKRRPKATVIIAFAAAKGSFNCNNMKLHDWLPSNLKWYDVLTFKVIESDPDFGTLEVKENGMSLVEMNKKLLQKVEELTLYIIEQQRQIDKLLSK